MTDTIVDAIDIEDEISIRQIVAELRKTHEPLLIRENGKVVALITEAVDFAERKELSEDDEAFRQAAGSWKDFDAEGFKRQNFEQRQIPTRPSVKR